MSKVERIKIREEKLDIDKWCELFKNGIFIPVETRLFGSSMEPLIRYRKDIVTIIPVNSIGRLLMEGDIVLFERRDSAHVVHRLYWIDYDQNIAVTWGDNCLSKDGKLPISSILGLVVSMKKNNKIIDLDTDKQRAYGIKWMNGSIRKKIWFFYRRFKNKFLAIPRKLYSITGSKDKHE